ncbi:HAD family hydrolase [Sphingomonas echinoides]|uniref:D,D-heptose 1,7-bisphosphate phosphatase n=1 Tax=Sphingomonas echinoides TaxID=59803 RepID=A0ABU4PR48_9SPHN|nr:HAD family hydrolase [Sphingomonas echinoides]MDX5986616.1 HAD family hydrolase [Sphingomonas echinoides]
MVAQAGLCFQYPPTHEAVTGPVVLLDRDGTIIVERDYLSDPSGVVLETGAAAGLRRLVEAGAMLVVVTNQSGIGRGYFDETTVASVNDRVAALLAREGVPIAGWYVCPHAPEQSCTCRKPAPGLVLRAASELKFDLAAAYVIGDKASDIGLGATTGAKPILVRTGYGSRTETTLASGSALIVDNLDDAAKHILTHHQYRRV